MIYAKKMFEGIVEILLTYDYQPNLNMDDGVVLISKEEYEELQKQIMENSSVTERDPDEISDTEALAIITGEVEIDETE